MELFGLLQERYLCRIIFVVQTFKNSEKDTLLDVNTMGALGEFEHEQQTRVPRVFHASGY